jgi:N-acetylmuramic acid 6-phosphate etherase
MRQKCKMFIVVSFSDLRLNISSPPTFSASYEQFIGLMAGGDTAIRKAVEGAEDSKVLPMEDLSALLPPLDPNLDTVIGISSSGRTPYVLGGLKYAKELGCLTVGIVCVKPSAMRGLCDCLIECVTGAEVVTGSTRLKAGTATKMVRLR